MHDNWRKVQRDLIDRFPDLTDEELAVLYETYFEYLELDPFFLSEMQRRGLSLVDLEDMLDVV